MSIDKQLYGVDLFGESLRPAVESPVAQKFLIPPFSVLNARDGDWQDRKRAWCKIGIQSEVGRDNGSTYGAGLGILLESGEESRTSIFDPVICELAYTWFTSANMQIIDPFAGGSVRGVVASCLGRNYWGCDLRQEQIDANCKQGDDICSANLPTWACGDSLQMMDDAPQADFVFSCPPYGDLEVYSDDAQDLSQMDHDAFLVAYRAIITKSCAKLKNNRFACFVVGDFRDKKGNYRNFVSDTIQAFLDAGMNYYNEAILVTSVGSASMRVTKQFTAGRKFAKTHQNILVFVKGCGKQATKEIFGEPQTKNDDA